VTITSDNPDLGEVREELQAEYSSEPIAFLRIWRNPAPRTSARLGASAGACRPTIGMAANGTADDFPAPTRDRA
jgi:hypothetical protein